MIKKAVGLLVIILLGGSLLTVSGDELPATLYYNPNGGSYYHADAECPSVKADFLPMAAFDSALLGTPEYSGLMPCTLCVLTAEQSPVYPQQAQSAESNIPAAVSAIDSEAAAPRGLPKRSSPLRIWMCRSTGGR